MIDGAGSPECEFWNFQLDNYWMESLDYRLRAGVGEQPHRQYNADGLGDHRHRTRRIAASGNRMDHRRGGRQRQHAAALDPRELTSGAAVPGSEALDNGGGCSAWPRRYCRTDEARFAGTLRGFSLRRTLSWRKPRADASFRGRWRMAAGSTRSARVAPASQALLPHGEPTWEPSVSHASFLACHCGRLRRQLSPLASLASAARQASPDRGDYCSYDAFVAWLRAASWRRSTPRVTLVCQDCGRADRVASTRRAISQRFAAVLAANTISSPIAKHCTRGHPTVVAGRSSRTGWATAGARPTDLPQ